MILITARRAAELAGVALSTVYRWIRADQLPHYRRGHWFRVDKADLTYTLE
jgi:excisionase family DNA binding protein